MRLVGGRSGRLSGGVIKRAPALQQVSRASHTGGGWPDSAGGTDESFRWFACSTHHCVTGLWPVRRYGQSRRLGDHARTRRGCRACRRQRASNHARSRGTLCRYRTRPLSKVRRSVCQPVGHHAMRDEETVRRSSPLALEATRVRDIHVLEHGGFPTEQRLIAGVLVRVTSRGRSIPRRPRRAPSSRAGRAPSARRSGLGRLRARPACVAPKPRSPR